jgi:hypothetical protein
MRQPRSRIACDRYQIKIDYTASGCHGFSNDALCGTCHCILPQPLTSSIIQPRTSTEVLISTNEITTPNIVTSPDTTDQDHSHLHKVAKAVQGRAVDWLQKKIQLPSQENRPLQPPEPPKSTLLTNGCSSADENLGTNDMSPSANDCFKLKFKVSHLLDVKVTNYAVFCLYWCDRPCPRLDLRS